MTIGCDGLIALFSLKSRIGLQSCVSDPKAPTPAQDRIFNIAELIVSKPRRDTKRTIRHSFRHNYEQVRHNYEQDGPSCSALSLWRRRRGIRTLVRLFRATGFA
jgi:hypothetical protein